MRKLEKISYSEAKAGLNAIREAQLEAWRELKLESDTAVIQSVSDKLTSVFKVIGTLTIQEQALLVQVIESMKSRQAVRESIGAMMDADRAEYSGHFDEQGTARIVAILEIYKAMVDTTAIEMTYDKVKSNKELAFGSMGLV